MRFPRLSLRVPFTAVTVVVALGLVSAPLVGYAQLGGDPSAERERVRDEAARVATQVDALQATDAQVSAALDALEADVAGQEALLAEAKRAARQAEQAFAEATAAVAAKTREIKILRDEVREFAVEAFVHPPSDDAIAALDSDDPGEAAQKRALLEIQNTSAADLLDRLGAAEEDLEVQRRLAADASRRAEEKQAEAGDRLAGLTEARDRQAAYAAQVEARLEHTLSEAAALQDLDEELSAQIAADQARAAELARRAASSSPRPRSGGGGGGGGGSLTPSLGTASCPNGGSIAVASSIVDELQSLLDDAESSGIFLCGGGYRSSEGQIETRRNNCGTSYYDIYEKPASECSPPTARPGHSMHERGLAVDFTCDGRVIGSQSSPCFQWLDDNANDYGFYNLASEPWHWSTNGN